MGNCGQPGMVAVELFKGTPRVIAPTYGGLVAAEAVLPRDADWRDATLPAGSQIAQTV
jgi:hypothetical protein